MKRVLMFSVFAVLAVYANGQDLKEKQVPQSVRSTVMELYPTASKIEWELEDGMYEADFMHDGKEVSVVTDSKGKMSMIKVEIDPAGLPGGALSYLGMHTKSNAPIEACKITDVLNTVTYEVETAGVEYLFDERGNFILMHTEEESGEDDK